MKKFLQFALLLLALAAAAPASATTKVFLKLWKNSLLTSYQYADTVAVTFGQSLGTSVTNSAASGTNIQWTDTAGGAAIKWISPPLSSGVTISGTVTFNLWGSESAGTCNCGERIVVIRYTSGAEGATVSDSSRGTELTTSITNQNWTATPTSTAFSAGDRIVIYGKVTNVGTMASGKTVTNDYGGSSAAADGDSWVQFNENLTFQNEGQFLDNNFANQASACTSLAGGFLGDATAGDMNLVMGEWQGQSVTATLADTLGNTYVSAIGPINWGTTWRTQAWYAKNVLGGANTATLTFSAATGSAGCEIYLSRYSGLDATAPLDVTHSGTGTSTTFDSGSAATNFSNELIVGEGSNNTGATDVVGTGYTERRSGSGLEIEDKSVTSTGSYNATVTNGSSLDYVALMITFKWGTQPAAAGGVKRLPVLGVGALLPGAFIF